MKFRGGLGKGLESLLPLAQEKLPDDILPSGPFAMIPLDRIDANPDQPRKTFSEDAIEGLAETIRKNGVLQPILVEASDGGRYVIISGERRTRAARIAGLTEIPATIKNFASGEQKLLSAILENLQREDLNPIEEAAALKQYMELSGLNQEDVAQEIGKNRATIANALRLLRLPENMQEALKSGVISSGHARALLSVESPENRAELFRAMISDTMTVREAERRALELNDAVPTGGKSSGGESRAVKKPDKQRDPNLTAMENRLITALGTKVVIDGGFERGTVKIEYFSPDDLEKLCKTLAAG